MTVSNAPAAGELPLSEPPSMRPVEVDDVSAGHAWLGRGRMVSASILLACWIAFAVVTGVFALPLAVCFAVEVGLAALWLAADRLLVRSR